MALLVELVCLSGWTTFEYFENGDVWHLECVQGAVVVLVSLGVVRDFIVRTRREEQHERGKRTCLHCKTLGEYRGPGDLKGVSPIGKLIYKKMFECPKCGNIWEF